MEENNIMNAGIYQIMNRHDYHMYIGSSVNIKKRWRDHKDALSKNTHSNIRLQRAWNKYGEDAFDFSVVEYEENLNILEIREQYYTDLWNPEYVIRKRCVGSQLGTVRSEESKQKSRIASSGENNPMYGRRHSEETKQKQMIAKLGEKNPMFGKQSWMKGKSHSLDAKQKLSNSIKEWWKRRKNEL